MRLSSRKRRSWRRAKLARWRPACSGLIRRRVPTTAASTSPGVVFTRSNGDHRAARRPLPVTTAVCSRPASAEAVGDRPAGRGQVLGHELPDLLLAEALDGPELG